MIERLTIEQRGFRRQVAEIHARELGGDLAALGVVFLRDFYYGRLLADPTFYCYVFVIDGAVAGFTAFSTDAATLIQRTVRGTTMTVVLLVLAALITDIRRIGAVVHLAKGYLSLTAEPFSDIRAEAMSTAVDSRYRTVEFHRSTGLNVARLLYCNTAQVLAALGVPTVKGFTFRRNVAVTASLTSLGWKRVWEGPNPRGRDRQPTLLWLWDPQEGTRRCTPRHSARA